MPRFCMQMTLLGDGIGVDGKSDEPKRMCCGVVVLEYYNRTFSN